MTYDPDAARRSVSGVLVTPCDERGEIAPACLAPVPVAIAFEGVRAEKMGGVDVPGANAAPRAPGRDRGPAPDRCAGGPGAGRPAVRRADPCGADEEPTNAG